MATNRGKYISVGRLVYRSDIDDAKAKARIYGPGDTVDEDLTDDEVKQYVAKGVLREAKQAKQEQKAREEAALLAQQAQDAAQAAADARDQAAVAQATGVAPHGDDGRAAAAGKRK